MEALTQLLKKYGRLLELEDSLPYWEAQRPELREKIRELKWNRDSKEVELLNLQSPNFFQRLFGSVEEKKDKLSQQLSQATAAWNAAKWELEALDKKIADGRQELESLTGSREAYAKARQEAVLTSIQEGQLMMEELAVFTPAARAAAERVIGALEEARPWMQQDAVRRGVSSQNRKMEFLALAAGSARMLTDILSIMPEGAASVGSYLRNPESYVTSVTSEYGQLDRLNNAIRQVRETRNQLEMLQ